MVKRRIIMFYMTKEIIRTSITIIACTLTLGGCDKADVPKEPVEPPYHIA